MTCLGLNLFVIGLKKMRRQYIRGGIFDALIKTYYGSALECRPNLTDVSLVTDIFGGPMGNVLLKFLANRK